MFALIEKLLHFFGVVVFYRRHEERIYERTDGMLKFQVS